ncbi:MAG: exodeoxyribonuclease VII large subunit, partial [Anaerolineales bacterium]
MARLRRADGFGNPSLRFLDLTPGCAAIMLAAMQQMALFGARARLWKVSELSRFLRELIETAEPLQDLWVQGEISNFSRPNSGHWYFTLKDKEAELRCVMWRTDAQWQTVAPEDGQSVEAHGRLS